MTRPASKRERRDAARAARVEAEQRAAATTARRRRLWQLGGLLAAALIVVVVAIAVSSGGANGPSAKEGEAVAGQDLAREEFGGIAQDGAVLGDPKAPYTLVEYADLICPACKAYADDVIPVIVQDYVRSGKLRLELRPFGFVRDWSTPAAHYAWAAAQQDKLHDFAKVWYVNQGDENDNYADDAFARRIASGVPGLDADRLIRDSRSADAATATEQTATQIQDARSRRNALVRGRQDGRQAPGDRSRRIARIRQGGDRQTAGRLNRPLMLSSYRAGMTVLRLHRALVHGPAVSRPGRDHGRPRRAGQAAPPARH